MPSRDHAARHRLGSDESAAETDTRRRVEVGHRHWPWRERLTFISFFLLHYQRGRGIYLACPSSLLEN
jgi:hypothetical protein